LPIFFVLCAKRKREFLFTIPLLDLLHGFFHCIRPVWS
jgi:hypothetical protein